MARYLSKSVLLLAFTVRHRAASSIRWSCGRSVRRSFRSRPDGSLVYGPDGTIVGSRMIAQPFTKDEYFQPRPSAASYNASASGVDAWPRRTTCCATAWHARSARSSSTRAAKKAGQLVAPDIDAWFQQDRFQGQPHIVAQWADAHTGLAQAWVKADPLNGASSRNGQGRTGTTSPSGSRTIPARRSRSRRICR